MSLFALAAPLCLALGVLSVTARELELGRMIVGVAPGWLGETSVDAHFGSAGVFTLESDPASVAGCPVARDVVSGAGEPSAGADAITDPLPTETLPSRPWS